jgi:hypothetical protein
VAGADGCFLWSHYLCGCSTGTSPSETVTRWAAALVRGSGWGRESAGAKGVVFLCLVTDRGEDTHLRTGDVNPEMQSEL